MFLSTIRITKRGTSSLFPSQCPQPHFFIACNHLVSTEDFKCHKHWLYHCELWKRAYIWPQIVTFTRAVAKIAKMASQYVKIEDNYMSYSLQPFNSKKINHGHWLCYAMQFLPFQITPCQIWRQSKGNLEQILWLCIISKLPSSQYLPTFRLWVTFTLSWEDLFGFLQLPSFEEQKSLR